MMKTFHFTAGKELTADDKRFLVELYKSKDNNPVVYLNDFLCHYVLITDTAIILGLLVILGEPDDRMILCKIEHDRGEIISNRFEIIREVGL